MSGIPLRLVPLAVLLMAGGASVLMPTPLPARQVASAAPVRGLVLHAETAVPLIGAAVTVVGMPLRTSTRADGRFTLPAVPLGEQTLRVVAIGFAPMTVTLTVRLEGGTVDIRMVPSVYVLEDVVVTATGDQPRRAVASAVGSIKADSVARMAAATTVDQLLAARVPGVILSPQSGVTGGGFSMRVRGANSIQLYNEPLWIIDGIRLTGVWWSASDDAWDNVGLSALNPADIESIDVIKGPAAAALYGTQAANGVVVIKTRRGRADRVGWSVYSEVGRVEQPANWTNNWYSWGRNLSGGVPQPAALQCRIANQAAGQCVIDSLTTFNPLRNPETSPFTSVGNRTLLGVQASGGSERLRFFASAEREDERGPYTMPVAERQRILDTRGVAPEPDQIHPSNLGQFNLRANFTTTLTPTLEVTLGGAHTSRRLQTPHSAAQGVGIQNQAVTAPGYRTPFNGYAGQHLGDIMSLEQVDEDRRLFLNLNATWTPRPWLTARLTSGMDRGETQGWRFTRNGEGPTGWANLLVGQGGGRWSFVYRREVSTQDLLVTATRAIGASLRSRTAVGAQYVVDRADYAEVSGYNLSPGDSRVNAASVKNAFDDWYEEATLGLYVEEGLAWKERAYLTVGLRTDRNSQFGAGYPRIWYPRAGLSWVISEEPFFPAGGTFGSVRLRGSWGRAGIPPGATAALQTLGAGSVLSGGQVLTTLRLNNLGNPDLRPEVVSELEVGVDLQLFGERLGIEATWYTKQSRDGLAFLDLPPSVGVATARVVNLTAVRNRGAELAVDAAVIRGRSVSWNLRLSGSTLRNRVLDLGSVPQPLGTIRVVEGYPIAGYWARPITGWQDANGDGILVAGEVTTDTAWHYVGPQTPTRELALTSTLGLLRGQVTVTAMFDHRGGHYRWWTAEQDRCGIGNCRAANDASAPLADQAAAVAAQSAAHGFTAHGYLKPADFTRFRELSVQWVLPSSVARLFRVNDATLVLAGRNLLMVSTKYPGIDPEGSLRNGFGTAATTDGSLSQGSRYVIPPLRYWLVRLNLGF